MKDNISQHRAELSGFYRYVYLISGVLLVAIGVIGIFLPLLPTTIFLILASACFVKGSPRANEWLRNHKILGAYIKNYQDKSGLVWIGTWGGGLNYFNQKTEKFTGIEF